MKRPAKALGRRKFLAAMAGAGAVAGFKPNLARAVGATTPNPFAYDVSSYEKTDPKLVSHELAARWAAPRPDARHISVGPDDQIYVCAGSYVSTFTAEGKPGLEIALPETVCCATVAADGTIFAATRRALRHFDPLGRLVREWGSPLEKSWFTGLASSGQEVFAADSSNRVILRFSREGKLLGRIGEKSPLTKAPGLAVPSAYLSVVLHPDGSLRVNNTGRHQIDSYKIDGEFGGSWGKTAYAPEGFCGCCNPVSIATLADGRIVTGEKGLPRVKIYLAAGEFESVVAGVESFPENAAARAGREDQVRGGLGVAAGARGRVCILDYVTGDVLVMRPKKA